MIIAASFWIFLISSLVILGSFGEKKGRQLTAACLLASIITYLTNAHLGFINAGSIVLLVDFVLLSIALWFVISTDRYWPVWFAAFQAITVASELANALFPANVTNLYGNFAGFWALPALGAAAVGAILDRRAKFSARHRQFAD